MTTKLKGIHVYYDQLDQFTPPFYAVDCDAVWNRFSHIEFTDDEETCIEDLVLGRYRLLNSLGMVGHGWSERDAVKTLDNKDK